MNLITILTPTGSRPEAFALAERWMVQQTLWADPAFAIQWIVVDDGLSPTPVSLGQTVIRPTPLWVPGNPNTQYRNLELGLAQAKGEIIVCWEDDDWYGPRYLEETWHQIKGYGLCGETPSRYFNVLRRVFRMFTNGAHNVNARHASLCQTAFHRDFLPQVRKAWARGNYPDLELWRSERGNLYLGQQVVGIKGMPGRLGVTRAHRGIGVGWKGDPRLERLQQWIGKDSEVYEKYGTA
jgi:hypothetical protein